MQQDNFDESIKDLISITFNQTMSLLFETFTQLPPKQCLSFFDYFTTYQCTEEQKLRYFISKKQLPLNDHPNGVARTIQKIFCDNPYPPSLIYLEKFILSVIEIQLSSENVKSQHIYDFSTLIPILEKLNQIVNSISTFSFYQKHHNEYNLRQKQIKRSYLLKKIELGEWKQNVLSIIHSNFIKNIRNTMYKNKQLKYFFHEYTLQTLVTPHYFNQMKIYFVNFLQKISDVSHYRYQMDFKKNNKEFQVLIILFLLQKILIRDIDTFKREVDEKQQQNVQFQSTIRQNQTPEEEQNLRTIKFEEEKKSGEDASSEYLQNFKIYNQKFEAIVMKINLKLLEIYLQSSRSLFNSLGISYPLRTERTEEYFKTLDYMMGTMLLILKSNKRIPTTHVIDSIKNYLKQSIIIGQKTYAIKSSREGIWNQLKSSLIIEDFMSQQFKVIFHGEDGIDVGGLKTEFVNCLIKEITQEHRGLFKYRGGGYFPQSNADLQQLCLFGKILGRIYLENISFYIEFSPIFIKHLLSFLLKYDQLIFQKDIKITFQDVLNFEKEKYDYYLKLYKGQITFEKFQTDVFMGVKYYIFWKNNYYFQESIEFSEKENTIQIEENEFQQYVLLEINKDLIAEVEKLKTILMNSIFIEGFTQVIPEILLQALTFDEFYRSLAGNAKIEFSDLKRFIYFEGFSKGDKTEEYFWQTIKDYSQEDRGKLIQFLTGCNKKIQHVDTHMPVAHLCSWQVEMPSYTCPQVLKQKLDLAIQTKEFHIA